MSAENQPAQAVEVRYFTHPEHDRPSFRCCGTEWSYQDCGKWWPVGNYWDPKRLNESPRYVETDEHGTPLHAPAPGVDHSHPTDPHVRFGVVLPSDAPAPGGAMEITPDSLQAALDDADPRRSVEKFLAARAAHQERTKDVSIGNYAEPPADRAPCGADHKDCMRYGCQYGHETGAWPHRVCPEGECQHARHDAEPAPAPGGANHETMKLTELDPRWIQMGKDFGFHCLIGVSFLCPCCRRQRLAVMFAEHIDPENNAWRIPWQWPQGKTWSRRGLTFETLSLSPSIDASASGHWHGFITNGEVF